MSKTAEIAGRYELEAEIGRGGMGVVYRARDRVSDAVVALKRPKSGSADDRARARREALALRLLRIPGVVALLDAGEDDAGEYLVTELVDGEPFPGRGHDLTALTADLLETLCGVHAAGIVHRDLKPHNVLVDRGGRVRLLDFGIARGAALGAGLTSSGAVLGTPRYLAPEQVGGGESDARTDLYALGLMLYEALTDEGPFRDPGDPVGIFARVQRDAPPVRDRAPHAPAALAGLVDRLLRRRPDERPTSAVAALALLRGPDEAPLRLVGRADVLARLLAAGREGRSVGLRAERGLGKTRLLREVATVLRAEGTPLTWLSPSERPLGSLRAGLGLAAEAGPSACRAAVVARANDGHRFVCDEGADRWSLALVAESGGARIGPGDDLALDPLDESALRDLFWGPDKVVHLREDGARELLRRSRGRPSLVAAEVSAWVAAGVATVEGGRVRLDRSALARLDDAPARAAGGPIAALPAEAPLRALLRWIALGGGELDLAGLAAAGGQPPWEVELLVAELAAQGHVELRADGAVLARPGSEAALALWTEAERLGAHRRVADALPPGARSRLRHLVVCGALEEIAAEAAALADALSAQGRSVAACHVLATALSATRADPALGGALVRRLFLAAMPAEDLALRRLARDEARRGSPPSPALIALADAAVAVGEHDFAAAEALLTDLGEGSDEALELARAALLAEAVLSGRPAGIGELLDRWSGWAERSPERRGRWLGWRGLSAYAEQQFARAAALHDEAATCRSDARGRITTRINQALALLDLGDLARAAEVATQVVEEAASLREPAFESRGWWILRSALYRARRECSVDGELVEAALLDPTPRHSAPVLFTEGVIAWRAGAWADARALLEEAERRFSGHPDARVLTGALLHRIGARSDVGGPAVEAMRGARLRAQARALRRGEPLPPAIDDRWEVLAPSELAATDLAPALAWSAPIPPSTGGERRAC